MKPKSGRIQAKREKYNEELLFFLTLQFFLFCFGATGPIESFKFLGSIFSDVFDEIVMLAATLSLKIISLILNQLRLSSSLKSREVSEKSPRILQESLEHLKRISIQCSQQIANPQGT